MDELNSLPMFSKKADWKERERCWLQKKPKVSKKGLPQQTIVWNNFGRNYSLGPEKTVHFSYDQIGKSH